MNTSPSPDDINEELMTRWIDGHLSPPELAAVERALAAEPQLAGEVESVRRMGQLLRTHLPATLEPASPEFFTSRIMEEIQGVPVTQPLLQPSAARRTGLMSWLRQPWFAPLASAAVVALLFLAANGPRSGSASAELARVYAPDPNVVAKAFYSAEAEATVIDLQGLQAMPADREIRAFDVADTGPAAPGKPRVFHAANNPDRALLVMAPDTSDGPRFRVLE